ncbi:MAG: GumC family protein [Candidatus Acidiferrales bacterium]
MTQGNTQNQWGEAPKETTLRDVLAPLFRRRRLVAISFVGILVGTIVAAIVLSGRYESTMQILVDRERLDPVVTTEQVSQTLQPNQAVTPEEINSEVQLLQSGDLLQKVVLANGLQEREKHSLAAHFMPANDETAYVSEAVKHLGKKLKVEAIKQTNMIQVSYQSGDPKLSYNVLSSLANLYVAKHVAVHRPTGSYGLFAQETDKYRKALEDSETRLANFGRDEGIAAPDVVRTDMAQEVANSMAARDQARQQIAADEQRIRDEQAQMKVIPARSATVQVSNSAELLLQQLQANLLAAQIKRTQLAMKYDANYPLVKEADQEIAETQSAISEAKTSQYQNQTTDRDPTYEYLREDVAKTQADLASQKATASALQTSLAGLKTQMVDLDSKALKQSDLLRETKADEANYLLYLSKREQERTSDALDQDRIANVAISEPPTMPVLPAYSTALILLIGFLLAICVSIGVAFIAEYLDPSFRTPAEVNEVLNVPVLASVPRQAA